MAKHKHHHARALERRQETIVQVIYKTAEKTFDGPIGGYKTMDGSQDIGNNNDAALIPAQQPQTQPVPQVQAASSPKEAATQAPAPVQPTQVEEPETTPTPEVETPVAVATPQEQSPPSQTPIVAASTSTRASKAKDVSTPAETSSDTPKPTQATKKNQDSDSATTPASTQTTAVTPTEDGSASSSFVAGNAASSSTSAAGAITSSQSDGMSGGAKAGLAIGILLAIGLLLGLIFFCYRRKKKQQREAYQVADDEKSMARDTNNVPAVARAASTRTSRTNSTAPRLSLRPVTQFLPDLAGKRKSGNALAAAGGRNLAPTDAMTGNRPTHVQPAHSVNPFGDHDEPSEKMFAPREERSVIPNQANDPTNPFGIHAEALEQPINVDRSLPTDAPVPAPLRIRTPTPEGHFPAAGTAGAAAAALAAAGLAGHKANAPAPLSVTPNRAASPASMPSPAGTEFSMSSATAASMANGPPPSNVHRVQLDFKPSMEDELGLRAGQLVRLLHELYASASIVRNKVSHHVHVFLLDPSSLARIPMLAALLPEALPRRACLGLASNVRCLHPVVAAHQHPLIVLLVAWPLALALLNVPCRLDRMVVDLSAPTCHHQRERDVVIRLPSFASDERVLHA
ncbi:MAG: hypothetical protein Q9208_002963 [Pyrenodesmia sp. 3 TL-2023]